MSLLSGSSSSGLHLVLDSNGAYSGLFGLPGSLLNSSIGSFLSIFELKHSGSFFFLSSSDGLSLNSLSFVHNVNELFAGSLSGLVNTSLSISDSRFGALEQGSFLSSSFFGSSGSESTVSHITGSLKFSSQSFFGSDSGLRVFPGDGRFLSSISVESSFAFMVSAVSLLDNGMLLGPV